MDCRLKLKCGDIVLCDAVYDFETKQTLYFKNDEHDNGTYDVDDIEKIIPFEPYELFGVECGHGWDSIIKPLFDYIEEFNKHKEDCGKIVILQVKEKFGELHFYVDNATEELNEMIRVAEDKSYETCEICGSTKDVGHTRGWITTICKECIRKNAIKNKNYPYWHDYTTNKLYVFDENGNEKEIDETEIKKNKYKST